MSKWVLYSLLFGLMVIWGFNVSAIKLLVMYFPPAMIQGFRVLMAGIIVILFLIMVKSFSKVSTKNTIAIIFASLFGVVGHHLFLAVGLTNTTATNAGLILGLIPLFTSVLAIFFLREVFTLTKFVGILVALVGVYFIVMNEQGALNGLSIGDLYILGAVITQAISFILIKKLTNNMESRQMTGMMLFFGALLLLVTSLFIEDTSKVVLHEIPNFIWWVFAASALFATGLGHVIYNYAMHRLGAGTTAIFINLTPFFSIVGSVLFLGEELFFKHIIGFACIVLGVVLGTGTLKINMGKRVTETKETSVLKG